jgi:opine dehydrogenase
VLGAGNGGLAAAADLTLRGHNVRLFSRSSETLAPIVNRGGIELIGSAGQGFVKIDRITHDLADAVLGADLVALVVPTTAHSFYAAALAGLLGDGQPVFLNPGHCGGGLHLVAELRRNGFRGEVKTCETATLTYGCRIRQPGIVDIIQVPTAVPFAAFPGKYSEELFELVHEIYPNIALMKNVLETAFANVNAVEHPPQTILNIGWIEHTKGEYAFYYEGTTPSVGRVIDAVDREKLSVARALGIEAESFMQRFYEIGYTTAHALEVGTAFQGLQESAVNRHIKGPKSVDHRYINEDIGHGLVAWASLGNLGGVDTPTIDHLIGLASVIRARDFAVEGMTLERMGLEGLKVEDLQAFLMEGNAGRPTATNSTSHPARTDPDDMSQNAKI